MAEVKKATVVEKKGVTDISTNLASFADLPTGFEGADSDSFAKPFLVILQPGSPQLVEDTDAHVEGAKPGMFFNTLTQELYGKSIDVIDFKFDRVYCEWKPDQGGFVGVHKIKEGEAKSVETSQFGKRIGRENDNEFVETHTHYLLIAGREDEGPIIFSLASSGIKHSRKWLSNAKMLRLPNEEPAPLFSSVYHMETMLNKNDQGRWYQIGNKTQLGVTRLDWVNGEQLEAAVEAIKLFQDSSELDKAYKHEDTKDKAADQDSSFDGEGEF